MAPCYRVFPPPADLRGAVHRFWELEGATQNVQDRVLPNGYTTLVFHYRTPLPRVDAPDRPGRTGVYSGQRTKRLTLHMHGNVGMVGVQFSPVGAYALLGIRAGEVRDRVEDHADLLAGPPGIPVEEITLAPDRATRFAILARWLRTKRLPERAAALQHRRSYAIADRAAHYLLAHGGSLSMVDLAHRFEAGPRFLQRAFDEYVGLSPKTFARVARLQTTIRRVRSGDAGGAEAALDAGYYDQSHMIGDFRRLTGLTPEAFFGQDSAFRP